MTDAVAKHLASSNQLETLEFSGPPEWLTDEGKLPLSPGFRHLNVSCCTVVVRSQPDGVAKLIELPTLEHLGLQSFPSPTVELCKSLADFPRLNSLNLVSAQGVPLKGWRLLAGNRNLQRLVVSHTDLTDEYLEPFLTSTQLTLIDLRDTAVDMLRQSHG